MQEDISDIANFRKNKHRFKLFQWRNQDLLFNKQCSDNPLNIISFGSDISVDKRKIKQLEKLLFLKNIILQKTQTFPGEPWPSFYCYFKSKKDLKNIIEVLTLIHGTNLKFCSGYYQDKWDAILHEHGTISEKKLINLVFPKEKPI